MINLASLNKVRAAAMAGFFLILFGGFFTVFGSSPERPAPALASASGKWTCSMHPEFVMSEPGKCPKCFMDLIPLESNGGSATELVLTDEEMGLVGIELGYVEAAEDDETMVTVPESALLWNLDRAYVYAEFFDGERSAFSLREVRAGRPAGDRREVSGLEVSDFEITGLEIGESVATAGLFRIDSAMQIQGKPSLVNPRAGQVKMATEDGPGTYQPAERSPLDPRGESGLALDEWFDLYEGVRAALAQDDFLAAAAPSMRLDEELGGARSVPAELAPLLDSLIRNVGDLARADLLEKRRTAFDLLSADMVLLARRYGSPSGGLNLVFCPMAFDGKGAHWLQPDETVDNPYHGLEMPRCGWVVEKIEE